MTRTLTNGFYDTTFGSGGAIVNDYAPSTDERWTDLVIDPTTSKIYTAGTVFIGDPFIAVGRYNSNGTLDTTFDGIAILSVAASHGGGIARDPATGNIVVAGKPRSSTTLTPSSRASRRAERSTPPSARTAGT